MDIKRGDIFYADLGHTGGSEQGGIRPVVIIQNDIGNRFSSTVIVASVTTKDKNELKVHVKFIPRGKLKDVSICMCEQLRTLDKSKLREKIGRLTNDEMFELDQALKISLALK